MKNLYTKKEFLNKLNENQLNEGILGKLFGWAGDLIKQGKIKAALNKYESELPEKTKERLIAEFEIEKAKKTEVDTKELEEKLNLLKEEENLIKEELKVAIDEVLKKKPELKLKALRLKISAEKTVLEQNRKNLKEIANDKNFAEIKKYITDKINLANKRDKELETELKNIENKEKGNIYNIGDIHYYLPKDDEDKEENYNIIILTTIEKDKDTIKDIMAKTIKPSGEDLRKLDDKEIVEFTPIKDNIKNKIEDEKVLSDIFGDLDKYKEYKSTLAPEPESEETEE